MGSSRVAVSFRDGSAWAVASAQRFKPSRALAENGRMGDLIQPRRHARRPRAPLAKRRPADEPAEPGSVSRPGGTP